MTIEIPEVGSRKNQEPMRYFDSLFVNFYLQYALHFLTSKEKGKIIENKSKYLGIEESIDCLSILLI